MTTRHMTAILVLATAGLSACGERAPEGATLIRATRLYVAPDAPAIDDAAVLIVEGRIAAAGPAADIPAAGAASLGQCDGGTLVAGFQNSHVHFTEEKFAGAKGKPAAELAAAMTEMLNRLRVHDGRRYGLGSRQHRRPALPCRGRRDRGAAHTDGGWSPLSEERNPDLPARLAAGTT